VGACGQSQREGEVWGGGSRVGKGIGDGKGKGGGGGGGEGSGEGECGGNFIGKGNGDGGCGDAGGGGSGDNGGSGHHLPALISGYLAGKKRFLLSKLNAITRLTITLKWSVAMMEIF
jgi:hypothetical protein